MKNLKTTFDPVKFNPEKWATAAKYAGMKYMVFTTKHHDGFCMFDTKYTDYKITTRLVLFHRTHAAMLPKKFLMLPGSKHVGRRLFFKA
jgi:alpha-L-fucosidase